METMSKQEIILRIEPGGHVVRVRPGMRLLEAAARAGLIVDTPCGGAGTCGKCRVRFFENAPEPGEADLRLLDPSDIGSGWRLGCQARLEEDAVIEIPQASVFGGYHQIQTTSTAGNNRRAEADIRKQFLTLPPPTLTDDLPDLMRVERALAAETAEPVVLEAPAGVLQFLGKHLRGCAFSGTVTVRGTSLLDFEPGNTVEDAYGLAFDIGTTTLVGVLMHLVSGAEMGVVSDMNPQTVFGDDVVSRIAFASRGAAELSNIRACLLGRLRVMVRQLCEEAGISTQHIYAAAFAGNTTMQHLLVGCDPASLGMMPFVPVFGRGLTLPTEEFNLGIHPHAQARVFPVIGGFVGGDTVAGMLATEVCSMEGPVLLVDIGTNGEIVLVHDGRIRAASTAAGPAFEGARISCGMRAAEGAIEKVWIDADVELGVIGNVTPRGLCGSGLIDVCGQLLKAGMLAPDGRLLTDDALDAGLPPPLRRRMRLDREGKPECVLYENGGRGICLTQQDVREVQLGVGAIRAGISILLKQEGLVPADLAHVLIAGGFGSFIRRDNAQRIGLIPHEVPHEKIRFVGNVALSGAKWAVISGDAWREAERLARLADHVELSQDPDFALEFAMAMRFPGDMPD
jgi:uncharacterized 2Fe-2S/4Fe-4S cluster protein (DUF4445 family)